MRNTVLLIDANVIISYITNRRPGFDEAVKILDRCRDEHIEGYMAFHTVSILWYVLRKKPDRERRALLLDLCELLTVTGASHQAVLDAIRDEAFTDFEDCLQEKCAGTVHADYIVTENLHDFETSAIPAKKPAEMLELLHHIHGENKS